MLCTQRTGTRHGRADRFSVYSFTGWGGFGLALELWSRRKPGSRVVLVGGVGMFTSAVSSLGCGCGAAAPQENFWRF